MSDIRVNEKAAVPVEVVSDRVEPPQLVTRRQAAEMLGVSVFKIRSMEGDQLHPVLQNGVNVFAAIEIKALVGQVRVSRRTGGHEGDGAVRRSEGDEASEVFKLLEEGKDLREIVIEARVSPKRVRALYREWNVSLEEGERLRHREERATAEQREKKSQEHKWAQQEREMKKMEREVQALFKKTRGG